MGRRGIDKDWANLRRGVYIDVHDPRKFATDAVYADAYALKKQFLQEEIQAHPRKHA